MQETFTFSNFLAEFPNDNICLNEIIKQRFPQGMRCSQCKKTTRHYKLHKSNRYACKVCRTQTSPLAGTLFEKSTTPLRIWFFALFLMTHTNAEISKKQLQKELSVTYKTAWRMHQQIKALMDKDANKENYKEHHWVFFNKLELSWVEKEESSRNNH